MQQGAFLFPLSGTAAKAKADSNGIIHHQHMGIIQPSHMLPEPFFVDGPNLFQQNHRVLTKTHASAGNVDMGRKPCFSRLTGYGCSNDSGRMSVARIILLIIEASF